MIALLAAVAGGAIWVFHTRMSSGRAYPEYSSLSSRPTGTSILFESYARLLPDAASRNYRPLDTHPFEHPGTATVFVAGVQSYQLLREDEGFLKTVENIARRGNRVVLAIRNSGATPPDRKESEPSPMLRRWGVDLHSGQRGEGLWLLAGQVWRVERANNNLPVVIERPMDTGSIVLMADSYQLTNEALGGRGADGPDLALLVWIAGSKSRIVFDESHLGITESGSVLGLVRRYRLQGLLFGLIGCAALYVWKSAGSFPPLTAISSHEGELSGHDVRSGLVSLLERGIAPSALLSVCVREWERSRGRSAPADLREQSESLARTPGPPVDVYRTIQELLTPESKKS